MSANIRKSKFEVKLSDMSSRVIQVVGEKTFNFLGIVMGLGLVSVVWYMIFNCFFQ